MSIQLVPTPKVTPQEQGFIASFQETGSQAEAYRRNYSTENWSNAAIASEAWKIANRPHIASIIASQKDVAIAYAQSLALEQIENLQALAQVEEGSTAAHRAVNVRASVGLLETGGIKQVSSGVVVNVDARRIDAQALGAWDQQGPDGLTGAERFRASQASAPSERELDEAP